MLSTCLSNAKKFKRNCVVAFLDISKAFDNIGHLYISKSLKSKGISENLHDLIMSLLSNNSVVISMGKETSNPIPINCRVPQGGPLSPILFNIAVDYFYKEIWLPVTLQKTDITFPRITIIFVCLVLPTTKQSQHTPKISNSNHRGNTNSWKLVWKWTPMKVNQ